MRRRVGHLNRATQDCPNTFAREDTTASYSLSHDGRDFLVVNPGSGHLTLIFNWLHGQAPQP